MDAWVDGNKNPRGQAGSLESSKIRDDSCYFLGWNQHCFFHQNEVEIARHQEAENLTKKVLLFFYFLPSARPPPI